MKIGPADLDAWLLWAGRHFHHRTVASQSVRFLAWRALAASAHFSFLKRWRFHFFSDVAVHHARDVVRRRSSESRFLAMTWSEVCDRERHGLWGEFPQALQLAEERDLDERFGPSSGRHVLAKTLLDEVNRTAWSLWLQVLWHRHGPVALTALGIVSAFGVSAAIGLGQSDASVWSLLKEWWVFLVGP